MKKIHSQTPEVSSHNPAPTVVFLIGAFSVLLGLLLYGSQTLVSTPLWGNLMIKSWGLCIAILGLYLIISGLVTTRASNKEDQNLSLTECPPCTDLAVFSCDLYNETENTSYEKSAG